MFYASFRSPVCDNITASYQDVTDYLVLLCFHLPAHWSQLSLITSLQFQIHHWAPTITHLLNSRLSNLGQWFPNYTPFIRFLCSGGGYQTLLWSFLLFAQYSWWQYSLKATLSNFNLSPGSGQKLHLFLRNCLLSSFPSALEEDHHF